MINNLKKDKTMTNQIEEAQIKATIEVVKEMSTIKDGILTMTNGRKIVENIKTNSGPEGIMILYCVIANFLDKEEVECKLEGDNLIFA